MRKYKNIFDAIKANDIEAVKTFLPDQLELKDKDGGTPLYGACQYGCTEIVRLLLDYVADINARDKYGHTLLHFACAWGRIETARLLLDSGADIDVKDNRGRTPLYYACIYGIHDTSELLVSRGADPTVVDNEGYTPLDRDDNFVKDESGNKVPYRDILIQLRAEYLNKNTIKESERTSALSSGWEMEM